VVDGCISPEHSGPENSQLQGDMSGRGVLRLGCAMLAALALSRILAQDDNREE